MALIEYHSQLYNTDYKNIACFGRTNDSTLTHYYNIYSVSYNHKIYQYMTSHILFYLSIVALLTSCHGQATTHHSPTIISMKGDTVTDLSSNIMVIYQDKQDVYWFGSWETGAYRYDGKSLINYTTQPGLLNNRI